MRRVLALTLFATLAGGGAALAEDPPDAPAAAPATPQPEAAPLKLVAIMLDTQQVMLWDEVDGQYQLARVGQQVAQWRLVSVIPEGKKVIIARSGVRTELPLVEMPRPTGVTPDGGSARMAPIIVVDGCGAAAGAAAPATAAPAVVAPAAPAPVAPAAPAPQMVPQNPYAAPAAPAPAAPPAAAPAAPAPQMAPQNPYASPTAPAVPIATPSAPMAPQNPYAPPAAAAAPLPIPTAPPAAEPAPAPAAPGDGRIETHTITRVEMNRELRDFDRLLAGITVAPAPGGGFVITRLDNRSWVRRIGLRQGDVVRSVAGEPVSTLEDAARVYARLSTLDNFLVVVERADRKLMLSYNVK